MAKSISITIYPTAAGAEYLSASDAMHQILDMVEALETLESDKKSSRHIIWRLTEAHTNSPPLTVQLEAFPVDPEDLVSTDAMRVAQQFSRGVKELLGGEDAKWLPEATLGPLKRTFERTLNGIGRSKIEVEDDEPFDVIPQTARNALISIERRGLEAKAAAQDLSRTEYGSVEVSVLGLTRWHGRPALEVVERLSGDKATCVLSDELASELGPTHMWSEVWEGNRLLIGGTLHYGEKGELKKIEAFSGELRPWTDVPIADLRDVDVLNGKTVSEHLNLIRQENDG